MSEPHDVRRRTEIMTHGDRRHEPRCRPLRGRVPPESVCWASSPVLAGQPAQAQVLYGSLIGDVADPSRAVLPGATVTVTNRDTGLQRETTTDGSGAYTFPRSAAGHLRPEGLAVSGFKSYVEDRGCRSRSTPSRARTCRWRSAGQTETVTVTGDEAAAADRAGRRQHAARLGAGLEPADRQRAQLPAALQADPGRQHAGRAALRRRQPAALAGHQLQRRLAVQQQHAARRRDGELSRGCRTSWPTCRPPKRWKR